MGYYIHGKLEVFEEKNQFEFIDEFGQQVFAEDDEPEGIMVSMETDSYDRPVCHMPLDVAEKFAQFLLKRIQIIREESHAV